MNGWLTVTNVNAARSLGWAHCVHFCEAGLETMEGGQRKRIETPRSTTPAPNATTVVNGDAIGAEEIQRVETLEGLREVWPEVFKPSESESTA